MEIHVKSKPSLTQVAQALGLSTATVSHAFNRPGRVSPATLARVLAKAEEMGYTGPDPAARQLRRGRADALGVLFTDELGFAFTDPAAVTILGGVGNACQSQGINLLLVPAGPPRPDAHNSSVANAVVDGFIVYSVPEGDPHLRAVLARKLPTVVIDSPRTTRGVDWVGLDDHGGAKAMGEYLASQGHRRIGIISPRLGMARYNGATDRARWTHAPYIIQSQRIQGLHDAMGSSTQSPAVDLPVEECHDNTADAGARALHTLLGRCPDLTAVCCLTDVLALGALAAARQRGLSIPEDLTITGFDDVPEAGRIGLTTVGQPLADKGRIAAEFFLTMPDIHGDRRHLLPTSLEIRATSGPPAPRKGSH